MLSTRIRLVTSRQNSRVKDLRAHMQRATDQVIAIEGEHLLIEALRTGLTLLTVFVVAGHEDRLAPLHLPDEVEVLSLLPEVFASAVATETPQPVAALLQAPQFNLQAVIGAEFATPLVAVAAGLQDPGNLGTLIRSAEAFGATGMVLLPGTVHHWNAKALRASSGSAFRLPIVRCDAKQAFTFFRENGIRTLAAVAGHGDSPSMKTLQEPVAFMIGNEGSGLSRDLIAMADATINIPCPGITESLNAAVAGSVLLYEASRQRGLL